MFDKEFSGKVTMVTGAGSGIGRAVAVRLAGHGAVVAAVDRDADAVRETVEQIEPDGTALALTADVSSSAAVDGAVEEAEQRLGPIDCLVNCAGVLRLNRILDL